MSSSKRQDMMAHLGEPNIFLITKPIKYKLADHMRNSMHISNEFLEHLGVYYLKHWFVPEFKTKLIDGQIPLYGYEFNVIYHQCTPAAAKAAKEIRLSFRKAKPEFNIEPYVLVQIVSID